MRVSIVIPTYNRAAYVGKAIDSVLAQAEPGDEVIVVDDGSHDDTPSVLAAYGARIRTIRTSNGGAGRARNVGIAQARNELVAFLDSDDLWFPGKLRLQRAFMQARPDVLFSFTDFEVELRDGSVHKRYLARWQRDHASWEDAFGPARPAASFGTLPEGVVDYPVYEGDLYRLQLTGLYVLTDTLMARRREAGDALHFAEDLKTYEDLECFFRLSRQGKGAFLDVDTVRQVDHPSGRLSQRDLLEKADARLALLRRVWGRDPLFLREYRALYDRTLDDLLASKAGLLLTRGDGPGARDTLREMSVPPRAMSLLAMLPGWMMTTALRLRRTLHRLRRPAL